MKLKNYLLIIIIIIILTNTFFLTFYSLKKINENIEENQKQMLFKVSNNFINELKKNIELKTLIDYYSKNKEIISKIILENKFQLKFYTDEFIKNTNINKFLILNYKNKVLYNNNYSKLNYKTLSSYKNSKKVKGLLYDKDLYLCYYTPVIVSGKNLAYIFSQKKVNEEILGNFEKINNIKIKLLLVSNRNIKTYNVKKTTIVYNLIFYDIKGNLLKIAFKKDVTKNFIIIKNILKNYILTTSIITGIIFFIGYFFIAIFSRSLKKIELASSEISSGNYNFKFNKSKIYEINSALNAFKLMSKKLQKTQNYLIQQEKLYTAGKLAAGLSHEINNPLVSCLGYTELLLEQVDDKKHLKYLSNIEDNLIRTKKIVKTLLNFSSKKYLCFNNINFYEIVSETINLVKSKLKNKNINIVNNIDKKLNYLLDKGIFQQILINLLLNSIYELKNNGIIEIKSELTEENLIIKVQDNGKGIDDNILNKVLDPFFTTKKEGEGSGLGLFLCYNYMKQLNGNIELSNNNGLLIELIFENEIK